jgi:hypothetical protein
VPSNQQIKNSRKPGAAARRETGRRMKTPAATHPPPAAGEVKPISKSSEWKLLYAPHRSNSTGKKRANLKDSTTRASPREEDPDPYKGLCKNCKKQKTCKLPKPEGGVWRCEDYQ